MKKKIAAIVLVSTLGFTAATQAVAGWGGHRMQQYGDCPMYNQQIQPQGQNMPPAAAIDPAVQEKIDKFFADNKDLQKNIMVKSSELRALMRADNPDYKLVGQLTGELFDLRATFRANAVAAGVDQYFGRGMGMGFGPGMGPDDDFRGKRGNGQGMGPGMGMGRY